MWNDVPLIVSCRHAQANVQAVNDIGGTALHYSASNGDDDCLRQLLEAKVRVCAPCEHVSADLPNPAWRVVCACCVRARVRIVQNHLSQDAGSPGLCVPGERCSVCGRIVDS